MINKIALQPALQTTLPNYSNSSEIIGSHFYLNPLIEKHISFALNFDFSLAGLKLGESLKPHTHSYETAFIQLHNSSIYCEMQKLLIAPKDLLVIAPKVSHCFEIPKNQKYFFGISINESISKSKNTYFAEETFFNKAADCSDSPAVVNRLGALSLEIFNFKLKCSVEEKKDIKTNASLCYLVLPLWEHNIDIKNYYFYFIQSEDDAALDDSFSEAVVLSWKNH